MGGRDERRTSERGAVLVQVAIALVGLMAFGAFVIDYGVLWVARRQAQNSADAGAMAGAVSMGLVDMSDQAMARTSAIDVAMQNLVWGVPPDITPGDVTFPACPPGSPGAGTGTCVRVDVFRNQRPGGSPLPVFFGSLAGVTQQGVRATATAGVLLGDSTTCVKPLAVPDKWVELLDDQGPVGWSDEDTFERYEQTGPNAGQLMSPADYYEAPGAPGGTYGPNGTGFTRESGGPGGSDYGRELVLRFSLGETQISPGWFQPVVLTPGGSGAAAYHDNIVSCNPTEIGPGSVLPVELAAHRGATGADLTDIIARDPGATWNPALYGGRGGVEGGCMAAATCASSPRIVAIPVYDPDVFNLGTSQGTTDITIVKVIGFFMERVQANTLVGRIMTYPSAPRGGTSAIPGASFVVSFALVR